MRDLRKYARNTQKRLVWGFLLVLLILGNGLIWVLFGGEAGVLGLLCTAVGLSPLLLIVIVLQSFAWIRRSTEND